jgi:cytochrome P450
MPLQSLISFEALILAVPAYLLYRLISDTLSGPLRHIPGPWYTKYTSAWYTSKLLQGEQLNEMEKMHKKYGGLVRIAPNMVSVGDVDAVRMIHSTHRFVKGPIYKGFHFANSDNTFATSDPVFYKARKRLVAPAFSNTSVVELEPYILEAGVQSLLSALDKYADGQTQVDMLKMFSFMTFDVMGEIMLGKPFGLLKEGEHPVLDWIQGTLMGGIYKTTIGPLLTKIFFPDTIECENRMNEFARAAIRKRQATTGRPDSLQKLIDARDEETGARLSEDEIAAEAILQMIAGTDTTAITLAWAIHFLTKHPEYAKKLQEEIDAAIPDIRTNITHDMVRDLPYLNAVLNEALRIHPVASGDAQRVVPPGGAQICGQFIPGGTIIIPQMYVLHRLESHWDEPERFNPERWLENSDRMDDMKRAFIPFSMGARACLGRNLAWMELRVTLAAIMRCYNFRAVSGYDMSPQHRFIVRPRANAVNVTITRREA